MKYKYRIQSKYRRLNHLYKIVDKNGNLIRFKFNNIQEKLFNFEKQNKENGRYKIIILKARQLGFSTYKLLEGLDRALFSKNQTCIITAHKYEKMIDLFKKIKLAYENIPPMIELEDGTIRVKPKPIADTMSEYHFDNNSRIKVSLDSRALTPTFIHITELAFMENAEEMFAGTLPSVAPNVPLTIETTANGMNNYFYKLRKKNENGQGEFVDFFSPWYEDDGYRSEREVEPNEFTSTAKAFLDKGIIDKQQFNRYCQKAQELGRLVLQEFPTIPEEAFLSSGNPVFDLTIISKLPTLPYKYGYLQDLRIYKDPEPDGIYFYGVDTSSGHGLDYSAIVVRDRKLNLYAAYKGYIEPDKICDIIDYLRERGYKGKIGIENNNMGIATIKEAQKRKRYLFLYREKSIDTITQRERDVYGWNTNSRTRPIMIADMDRLIRTGELREFDDREKSELFSFYYNTNMKPEAVEGSHDDMIIADAICIQMTILK